MSMALSSLFPPLSFNKALKFGLWSIWLSGFLLICLSLYATQLLPPSIHVEFRKPSFYQHKGLANSTYRKPSITIFSAPSPFNGSVGERQALAVRSWLGLSPDINVVLFGNDPSLQSFASSIGSRVLVESDIDFSFLDNPFFHSMVARAQASSTDISVLIHPETILLPDFLSTLNHVYELDHDWFLLASSRRVSSFPFYLDEAGKHWLREDGKTIRSRKLQEILAQNSQWDYCEGRMLMAWNNRDLPLHMGVLPPFLYGKGLHDHWFINEVYQSKYRFVFDASLTISNFYVHDSNNREPIQSGKLRKTDWEYNGNHHLGELYGLFSSRKVNFSDIVKLVKCRKQFIFADKENNIILSPLHQSSHRLWKKHIMQSRREKKIMGCLAAISPLSRITDCPFKSNVNLSMRLHLPFGLETLLPMVADKNRTIVLAIAGYSYKDMLMSWVCRLRRLNVKNFMVCALDDETYEFSILQGLPVFKDSLSPKNISFDDCHFGTKCFQNVTKTKSRLVLHILKLGYNVLLSDVDVYWFKNPIPLLQAFGPGVLAAQSDEYNLTVPINRPRRLNSGFYLAWSDDSTIVALEKVVQHAMISDLSERPSFYDTLCGQGGSDRVGIDRCKEPETNLTVQFLNRYVLHNNWISGRIKKLERQVHSGLWDYDISSRMCLHRWHRMKGYISSKALYCKFQKIHV